MTGQLDRFASAVAADVAWHGHMSDARIAAQVAKVAPGADASVIVSRALALGLLRPVPRLGGYVAARKVNAREFGEEFAGFLAGDRSV